MIRRARGWRGKKRIYKSEGQEDGEAKEQRG
jgi:hypothetical protein